jgi:outer membrane lipoprotein-sorting protein
MVAIAVPGHAANPWHALETLRIELTAAGPLVADFTQTYVPAGFSSGEEESGRLAFSLPACLRWDYETPYGKTFLLCGEEVHFWNTGEASGRHYRISAQDEPGLDLLLLATDDLSLRYNAAGEATAEGLLEITLLPVRQSGQVIEAKLVVETYAHRLMSLSYRDLEGNLTRFEISGYRPLQDDKIFTPPAGMGWQSDQP